MLNSRPPEGADERVFSKKNRARRSICRSNDPAAASAAVTARRTGSVNAPTPRGRSTAAPADRTDPPQLPPGRPDDSKSSVVDESTRQLLHESARSAAEGADRLLDATVRIAGCFRRRELQKAESEFSTLIAALRTLTRVTGLLAATGGTAESRNRLNALVNRLGASFELIARHEGNRSWYKVANLIDHDLAGTLHQWMALLKALDDELDGQVRSPVKVAS